MQNQLYEPRHNPILAGRRLVERVRLVELNLVDAVIALAPRESRGEALAFARAVARLAAGCRGRGCQPPALAAAIAYYSVRRLGIEARPRDAYSRLGLPRQSFHNALTRLLEALGHSQLFKHTLYGRLGARVCRLGARVLWEAYGKGPGSPACPGILEEWPGKASPRTAILLWRGGALRVKLPAEFEAEDVLAVLRDAFDAEYFAAREASRVLLLSRESAVKLLDALAEMGLLERVEIRGRRLYRVPDK